MSEKEPNDVKSVINPDVVGTPFGRRQRESRKNKCLIWELSYDPMSDKFPPNLQCENHCGLSTGRHRGEIKLPPNTEKPVGDVCLFQLSPPEDINVVSHIKS